MELFNVPEWELIVRLLFALCMGLFVGAQRTYAGGQAGLRTYGLVSLGSALFVVTAGMVTELHSASQLFDPLRVAAQIVVGIGFLGAGVIFTKGDSVTGLTTAAGLWVMAAVGMASGFGFYLVAGTVTILIFLVLSILQTVERRFLRKKKPGDAENDNA